MTPNRGAAGLELNPSNLHQLISPQVPNTSLPMPLRAQEQNVSSEFLKMLNVAPRTSFLTTQANCMSIAPLGTLNSSPGLQAMDIACLQQPNGGLSLQVQVALQTRLRNALNDELLLALLMTDRVSYGLSLATLANGIGLPQGAGNLSGLAALASSAPPMQSVRHQNLAALLRNILRN